MDDNYKSFVHSFLKSELIWICFQLSRKNGTSLNYIQHRFQSTLSFLKQIITNYPTTNEENNHSDWNRYLQLFFTVIAFTRDSLHGLGEHDLTYMLIFSFYDVFPELSVQSIHYILHPLTNDLNNVNIGSWRDTKYLCKYVYEMTFQTDHPIITYCISLMNRQLHTDLQTWKFSSNPYSKYHISNIAKHIPREKSRFGWLFDKLAIHWVTTHKPYILQTPTSLFSNKRAISKSKSIYRKIISYLNKALHTPQISFCKKKSIDIQDLTINTYIKNQHIIHHNELYSTLSHDFIQNIKTNPDQHFFYYSGCHYSQIPIEYIIKKSIYLYKNKSVNASEESLLNNLWNLYFVKKYNVTPSLIPIIDVSNTINSDSFYAALGNAILLSSISSFENRLIAVDKFPTWIQFQPDQTIVQKVHHFMSSIYNMSNTFSNFANVFSLLSTTIQQTTSQLQNNDQFAPLHQPIKFVLISQFQKNNLEDTYLSFTQSFPSSSITVPTHLIMWNFSNDHIIELNNFFELNNVTFISGFSPNAIYSLINHQEKDSHYDYLLHVLSNNRYKLFSAFVKNNL